MPLRFAVLTVSDRASRGERPDASGPAVVEFLSAQGWQVTQRKILPDDQEAVRDTLARWADQGDADVIVTTGGTGFGPRDVTPEATLSVMQREAPGLAEAMRAASMRVSPHAMLSRARAGIRGRALLLNLPGSPQAAVENLRVVLPALEHAVQLLQEDPRAESSHRKAVV